MSSPTVVDVVISGTTATVVDTRVDGITTVEGTPQVTNVSGQIPDLGVTTNYLAGQGEILSLINDVANLRANVIITGQTLTDEIGVLSGVLISTGNYLESNILTLSGNLIASGNNLDSLRDILSGNLITTGQTLQTQITSNDADIADLLTNLITTGQTLQTQITSNDTDITNLTSNLVTTGQTLTTDISAVSSNLISTGKVVDDISGNLITTGQTLQTQVTANDGDIATLTSDLSTLTSNVVTTGQTLQTQITSNDSDIATLDSTTVKLTTNQSIAGNKIFSDRVTINNLHVTGTEVIVDVENLAVKDNLIHINSGESGAGISRISGGITIDRGTEASANILYNDANERFEFNFPLALEGNLAITANQTGVYASAANLITTGQTLQTQITSNDSNISTLTTNLVTTGATLTSEVGIVSGLITDNDEDITALKTATGVLKTSTDANTSNLISTGNFLESEIAIVSGVAGGAVVDALSGNLITTGQTLTTDINTVSSNLITTGQTLTSEIAIVSGLTTGSSSDPDLSGKVDTLSGNLITTGQTLQTQITSNDGDIASLTTNLITTGQTLTTNLVTTGNFLDSEIGIVSGIAISHTDITELSGNLITTGQTLTTDINAVSSNLITTGQTLQTQITSNDSDISNLTSNVITTGQTLTSEIAIVSGIAESHTDVAALSGKVDDISGNLITTGQTLQTQITSNDGDITTLTSNLITTGQTLTSEIAIVSGIATGGSAEDFAALSGDLITTGQTLQTQITSNDSDISTLTSNLISTGSVVDDVSGNLIATGQTLTTSINTNSSNLITTGQTLTSEIAIVSGIAEAHTDVSALSGKVDDISGNLITTGQTLTTNINTVSTNLITTGQTLTTSIDTVSSNLVSTGAIVDDVSGNLITTGQTLQTQITSNDGDITNLTSNLITTGQTLTSEIGTVSGLITDNDAEITALLAATGELKTDTNTNASNLVITGQTLTSEIAIVSGIAEAHTDVSALSGKVDDISGNLITTGQTLQTQITSNDTDISNLTANLISTGSIVDDISGNLITTGQTLQTQITSNDGDITNLTSNLITTGQTLTTEITTVSGLITDNDGDITALKAATGVLKTSTDNNTANLISTGAIVDDISGNLITSGQTLQTQITSNDSDISTLTTNVITTGQTLTTDIDSKINTVTANLITTGQTLTSELAIVSGIATGGSAEEFADLSGNLITTGQTLQTQITSNDSDISTLTSNLVATGSVVDDISGNLITTGQTLQTQITSNDSDISTLTSNLVTTGQTLTTNVNTVASNLVSTGTVVDDISGNLITTGQTLQTQITSNDTDITNLTSNLVTTGQTLTTDINTVSSNLVSTGSVVDDISGNLITTGQTLQTQITSNDGDITSLTSNLITTGQTLQTQITSNDGDIATLDSTTVKITTNQSVAGNKIFTDTVTINNLTVTGTEVIVDVENLAVRDNIIHINSGESGAGISRISGGITIDRGTAPSANILYNDANDRFELNFPLATEGNVVASAANLITTGQTLTTNINTVSTNLVSTGSVVDDISGNLITTGQTLQTQITANDADIATNVSNISSLTTNLVTTGQTLQTQITSNDSDISTLTSNLNTTNSNLVTTGQTLTTNINTVSANLVSTGSVVDDISGNLITTGQTLQTQITSNDGDISTLTSNLVTTGQTLTTNINTVSSNLISTGAIVDDISGNLITTGQTLQTQITSNDTDITNLTSNLVTTGQTLTTNTDTVAANLVTTGQTLTSEIITVSGLIPATVIDGGGTANKVPLWSDANTIGDSVISQSSSKIGIGTATPDSLLHISSTSPAFYIEDSNATSTHSITSMTGGTNFTVDTRQSDGTFVSTDYQISKDANGASYQRWFTQGTERMRITSDGKVGIGTTAPDGILHVANTTYVDATTNTGTSSALIWRRLDKTIVGRIVSDTTNLKTQFWDNNNAVLTIGSDQVGIGTTAPSCLLELYSSAPELTIKDGGTWGTNATAYINLKDSSSSMAYVGVTGTGGDLDIIQLKAGAVRIFTSNTQRLIISAAGAATFSGTLAATTVTASGIVNVGGGTAFATGATIKPASNNYQVTLLQSNVNNAGWGLWADTGGALKITRYGGGAYGTAAVSIALNGVATFAQELRASTGLAVTGAISASTTLTVTGATTLAALTVGDLTSITSNSSGYALRLFENSGGEYFQLGVNSYGGLEFYNETTKVAEFYDTGDFKIPDGLKILMGTGDDLQIYHDGSHSYIDDAGTGGLYLRSNDFRVYNAAGSERMIQADDDGAVVLYHNALTKLATTSTGVTVTGALKTTTILDTNNSAGTSNQVLTSTGSALDWKTLGEISGVDGSGTANYIPKWTDTDTIGNSVIAESSSKIGIGTAAPAHALDVVKAGTIVVRAQNSSSSADASFYATNTLGTGIFGINATGQYMYGLGNFPLLFYANYAERMRVQADGKVGIGLTPSSQVLETKGNISFYNTSGANPNTLKSQGASDASISGHFHTAYGCWVRNESATRAAGMDGTTGGAQLMLYSNSVERIRIDNNGNVGIGTTAPARKLHVLGGTVGIQARLTAASGWGTGLEFYDGDTSGRYWRIGTSNNVAGDFSFISGTSTGAAPTATRVTILKDGYVGIGTATPNNNQNVTDRVQLAIGNTAQVGGRASGTPSWFNISHGTYFDGTNWKYYSAADEAAMIEGYNGGLYARMAVAGTNAGDNITWVTALTVLNTGYVHMDGAAQVRLTLGSQGTPGTNDCNWIRGTGTNLGFNAGGGSFHWEVSGTERMNLAAGGQLKLNTYGSGTHTGTAAYKLSVTSGGIVIETAIGAGAVDGAGTTNYISKWTDGDTIGNSIIYDNGTNVGIGTANPQGAAADVLQVGTTANFPISLTTSYPSVKFNTYYSGGNKSHAAGYSSVLYFDPAAGKLHYQPSAASVSAGAATSISTKFTIDSAGKVGIGTTSPGAPLEVVGGSTNNNDTANVLALTGSEHVRAIIDTSSTGGHQASLFLESNSNSVSIATTGSNEMRFSAGGSERVRIISDGNVGIGTTAPAHQLTLYQAAPELGFYDTQGSSRNWVIRTGDAAVGDFSIKQSNAAGGNPVSAGTRRFYINSSGIVGIGVTPETWHSSYTALQFAGNGALSGWGNQQAGAAIFLSQNSYLDQTAWKYISTDEASRYEQVNGAHTFSVAPSGTADAAITWTTALTINTSGKVGIGTNAPATLFHCQGNATFNHPSSNLQVDFTANNSTILNFTNGTSEGTVFRTDEYFRFDTGGSTERMRIISDGKVGIGIATPYGRLETALTPTVTATTVNETADFADKFVISNAGTSANGDRIPLIFNVGGDGADNISTAIVGEREASGWNSALSFWVNNVTAGSEGTDAIQEAMRITSAGSVGIGTTAPSSNLEVIATGSSLANTLRITSGTAGRGVYISAEQSATVAGAIDFRNGNVTTRYLDFRGEGVSRMVIQTDGNVGIGTTAPGSNYWSSGGILHIKAVFPALVLESNSGRKFSIGSDYSVARGGWLSIRDETGNADRLVVDANGNVGIGMAGTTAITQKLHVAGNMRLTGGFYDKDNSLGSAGQILTTNGSATYWSAAGSGTISGSGTDNYIPRFNGTSALQDSAVYASDAGDLGFGTTSPSSTIHLANGRDIRIDKSGDAGRITYYSYAGVNTTPANDGYSIKLGGDTKFKFINDRLGIGNTAPAKALHIGDAANVTGNGTIRLQGYSAGGSGNYHDIVSYGDNLTFYRNSTMCLFLQYNGKVGIGTTAPAKPLHISDAGDTPLQIDCSGSASTFIALKNTGGTAYVGSKSDGISFYTTPSASERLTILSGGNVGIGTTAPAQILHVAGGNLSTIRNNMFGVTSNTPQTGGETNVYHNAYYDTVNSREEYLVADEACGIKFINGQINFRTAAAGSADGAITWINAVSILADGKVGIGTSAPDGSLDIEKTVNTAWSSALRANDFLQISNASTTSGVYSGIELIATGTGSAGAAEIVCIDSGSGSGDLAFSTRNSSTWGEKMRIQSDGNVGIGTTAPVQKLHVVGGASTARLESTSSTAWLQLKGSTTYSWQIGATSTGFQFYSDETATYTVAFNKSGNATFSGNLSAGGAGSTWVGYSVIQVKAASMASSGVECELGANVYYNSGWKYYNGTVGATLYEAYNGVHKWKTAPSGTVNTAVALTDRMNLSSTGLTITGTGTFSGALTATSATFTGVITADAGLVLNDNDKIKLGTGGDLEIFHTGSESYISDVGGGDLNLATNGNRIKLWKGVGVEAMANFEANGAVTLYYNGAAKLATSNTGVSITGGLGVGRTPTSSGAYIGGTEQTSIERSSTAAGSATLYIARTGTTGNQVFARFFHGGTAGSVASGTEAISLAKDASWFLGSVGIGTTAPGAKLDVRGADGYLKFDTSGADGTIKSDYNLKLYADDTGNNSSGYQNIQFYTAGANERMRIAFDGKIQIGNNVPMWSGSYGGALFLKGNNATSDRYAQLTIVDSTGSSVTTGLVVSNAGDVGIGTVSPNNVSNKATLELNAVWGGVIESSVSGTVKSRWDWSTGGITQFGTYVNEPLHLITNSSMAVTILGDGNVGIGSASPAAPLDVPRASDYKVTKFGGDVTSHYVLNGNADHTLTLTSPSYFQAEIVITANQTNGGTYNNFYMRGIWSNNHESHHWDEIENIGSLSGSTFTVTVGQNGATTNSGEWKIVHDYVNGSFDGMTVRITDFYGTHSYTIS